MQKQISPFPNSGIKAQVGQPYSYVIKMEGVVTYDGDMVKLTADNCSYQKAMMQDHLICNGLAKPILNKNIPEGKRKNEWKLLNNKAVTIILEYTDRSLFDHVSYFDNVYGLWTKLKSWIQKRSNKGMLVR